MKEYKILFTGTVGAGKTTAIGAVSEVSPVVTDVPNSDTSVAKELTTVGLDYGVITLESGDRVRLYGTPGQERFDFLWKILSSNALGLIILADNSRPDPLKDFEVYLKGFAGQLDTMPCAVGVGRLETHPQPSLEDYIDVMERNKRIFPVLDVDVRQREDVVLLIDTLLAQIEAYAIGDES